MSVKKLYTAVGRLVQQRDKHNQICPVIMIGRQEYLVDPQEFTIWICLNWRIVRWEEIGKFYEKSAAKAGYSNSRSWEACTNRLLTRGLLVCGYGETEYDALYDLLASMYIIPAMGRCTLRLYAALKMMIMNRVPFSAVRRLFRPRKHTPMERQILHLARQALISSAEVISCMEKGVNNIRWKDALMKTVYADRDTTSDNIADMVKACSCSQDAIVAIANLYMSQQLVFDRV